MKFDKKKIFGLVGQLIFAIFIIIALYGTGFDKQAGIHATFKEISQVEGLGTPDYINNIYGLGIASIVIAFVAVVLPLISMFVENKKMNMAFGWVALVLDVAVLALALAAFGLYTSNNTKDGVKLGNAGYIAGSFIFTIVGAGLGIAGNAIAYKADLKQA